jgi:DNA repair exonuclease SbcCD nuclease subunit
MPRLALIGDSHFNAAPGGRFAECCSIHQWIAQDIAERGVDLCVHSGDIFERKSSPDERRAVAMWIQAITRHAPMVIVKGNHDAPLDLSLFEKLETDNPVIVEEGAGVHYVNGFLLGCLAWPTKASVLAMAPDAVLSHAEGELIAGEALRNVLRGLGAQMEQWEPRCQREAVEWANRASVPVPKILVAHAMVRGSRVSTGQPLVGCDFELGLEDLELAQADFCCLGHIHMPQDWTHAGKTIVYPGSPRRTTFGELEEKSYVIADFDGTGVTWQRIVTPCNAMLHVDDEWGLWPEQTGGERAWLCGPPASELTDGGLKSIAGAEIRFRYEVSADFRDEARAAAQVVRDEMLALGAASVQVEEVVKSAGTARAPEVAKARTLIDKLRAYWAARHTEPEAPRDERLLGKASDLEAEQHAL